ncbi:E3 ubiquitin-protein ligase HECW1-like protein [Turdus rufiventris]|nr:E3 ubiquitin-protein ligase HECW1-like protein [Turdus rufiventris]
MFQSYSVFGMSSESLLYHHPDLHNPIFQQLENLYQNRFLGLAAMASPSRNSQNRRRCKEPLRYSYNPDQFHNMDIRNSSHEAVTIPRSTSDTDLVTSDSRSTLMVSSSYYSIGHSQDLVIYWDIKEEVDAGDWIGMYLIDEVLSENFLDYKNRGVNGSHRGQIIWKIDASSYFVERKAKNVTKTIEYVDKTETLDEIVTHSFCKPILWALM